MSEETTKELLREAITNALSENYESIYSVDLASGAYDVYYESDSYRDLKLSRSGSDFFKALEREVEGVVDPEDRPFVLRMLSKEKLVSSIENARFHSVVYRIMRGDHRVYHQLRATLKRIGEREYALIGVRDVDSVMRMNAAREEQLTSERERSDNRLSAILSTAVAYAEANLTSNRMLTQSAAPSGLPGSHLAAVPSIEEIPPYEDFQRWIADNLISENANKYLYVSSREHLIGCFERGIARASVPFSIRTQDEDSVPCRAVFFLYREEISGDILVLCVIYDLTEEQRHEKELEELRSELRLSRIRNSASQVKPHFLYNALGSIQEIVLDDPECAESLLEDFTVHLRGCIKAMDSDDPIPFVRELDNIRAYTNIEKMRFGDRLDICLDLRATKFDVLPLSIQPLVENAIRHGIQPLGKRGGTVTLRSFADEDQWVVEVIDDGKGFDVDKYLRKTTEGVTDSTGLKNIRFRLEKLLGASMSINSEKGAGTTVTVRIPKKAY